MTNESDLNVQTAELLPYYIALFNFTLISPSILLKTFLSKTASRLATSLFNNQDSAPYVATGLI